MDAKMDSGYVAPNDTFEAEYDPTSPLDMRKVLWIMDQLFCLEINWHDGYPLSQTIFTSLHIDRLLDPKQENASLAFPDRDRSLQSSTLDPMFGLQILKTYCVALIKCCHLVLM